MRVAATTNATEEQELLAGCLAQDRVAQEQLYRRYCTPLFSSVLRLLGSRDLAQDALQEGFVEIFRHLGSFRGESSLRTWMHTIMMRQALSLLRREQRMVPYDAALHPEPLVAWHDQLTGEALEKAIAELPPGYRSVFCLVEVEGYLQREAAELLGISEGTIKSQLHQAKRLLQTKLYHVYR